MSEQELLQQILLELKTLNGRQSNLEAGQAKLEAGQAKLEAGLEETNLRLDQIEEDTRHTRILVEKDVRHDIKLIAEQHADIIEKLSVTKEVDSLKGRVSTLEGVVKSHTNDIAELKKAQ